MKIGVIGGGVVGAATARAYIEFAEVRVHDHQRERGTHCLSETLQCDLVFVCLPTPDDGDGSLDCFKLDRFFGEQQGSDVKFVLRSTVPIGTTRRLKEDYGLHHIVHSPEFLTARCALVDAQMPARNLIGGMGYDVDVALTRLYGWRFPGVPLIHCRPEESEFVKLMQNSFFACKIAFFNECRSLSDHLGLDWRGMIEVLLLDGRIHRSHTQVPGPDRQFGFGGNCLEKDLQCLAGELRRQGLIPAVTTAALTRNKLDRGKDQ